MTDSAKPVLKQINLKRTFAWAGALVVVDAFFLNQGALAAIIGIWMLFVSLPRAAFVKENAQKRRRLARVGIFVAAVALVFALNWTNNQIAASRAGALVAAVKAFKQKHQRYPEKLGELVPEFIDQIPDAKYTLPAAKFSYASVLEFHSLSYVVLSPFGRRIFNFEKDSWGHID